jgi:hypothetical protein
MNQSPSFSSFRSVMDTWDEHEEKLGKVKALLDGNGLLMFFRRGDTIYGAPEEGRIVFAKMKTPDEEIGIDWAKDASFSAFDLLKALTGDQEQSQCVFAHKDLGDLEMMDRDNVEQLLASLKTPMAAPKLHSRHGKEGAGKIKLKDKK